MSYNVTLSVPAISCGHCVMTIKRETQDVPGVINVEADQNSKTATYTLESEAVLPSVKATLAEIGYPAEG
jgi:copper chaperone